MHIDMNLQCNVGEMQMNMHEPQMEFPHNYTYVEEKFQMSDFSKIDVETLINS